MMMMPWGKGKGKASPLMHDVDIMCLLHSTIRVCLCVLMFFYLTSLWPWQGLRGFANEKKVWIGGLPAGPTSIETNKKLKEHMSQV